MLVLSKQTKNLQQSQSHSTKSFVQVVLSGQKDRASKAELRTSNASEKIQVKPIAKQLNQSLLTQAKIHEPFCFFIIPEFPR